MEKYKGIFNSRKLRGWGGVALLIRSDLTFIPRPDLSLFKEGVLESVFIEIIDKGNRIVVGCIYRPPNSNISEFFENLGMTMEKIKNTKSYIMGDFNFDLLKYNENAGPARLLDELSSTGFQPLISKPTRITPHTSSIIDNIFTNDICTEISSGLILSSISDHFPIFVKVSKKKQHTRGTPQYINKREMGRQNKSKFKDWLKSWGNQVSLRADNVEEDATTFIEQLKHEYNKCFPMGIPTTSDHRSF